MTEPRASDSRLKTAPRPVTADRLRDVGLFGALPDETLDFLLARGAVVPMTVGDVVFKEGDHARELFVLLDGELEVLKRSRTGRETRVAMLGPGDSFGEMSLIDLQPRSATVRALASARLFRLGAEDLDALYRFDLRSYAIFVLNIARDMSRRLRVTDGLLATMTANLMEDYVDNKAGAGRT